MGAHKRNSTLCGKKNLVHVLSSGPVRAGRQSISCFLSAHADKN